MTTNVKNVLEKEKEEETETNGWHLTLVEKNCITCKLGDIPLKDSKICWECITTGKSRWRKKPKFTRKSGHSLMVKQ